MVEEVLTKVRETIGDSQGWVMSAGGGREQPRLNKDTQGQLSKKKKEFSPGARVVVSGRRCYALYFLLVSTPQK